MSWLFLAAAASGWSAAIAVLLVLTARLARRETGQALRLRGTVEPYLLRRAQELGVDTAGTSRSVDRLDEMVDALCQLAQRLAAREREQFTETQRIAVASTLPIDRPPQ